MRRRIAIIYFIIFGIIACIIGLLALILLIPSVILLGLAACIILPGVWIIPEDEVKLTCWNWDALRNNKRGKG